MQSSKKGKMECRLCISIVLYIACPLSEMNWGPPPQFFVLLIPPTTPLLLQF